MEKDYKKELIKLVEKTEINKGYHDYFKNKDLVNNYFEIGKLLIEAQGGEERAKYGNGLIKEWSIGNFIYTLRIWPTGPIFDME